MGTNTSFVFDDNVTVDELFGLLERMMSHEGDRFPARNVFHAALRSREKEAVSLRNTISVTARSAEGRLLGYLRVLTDQAYMYYLLDVMVDPQCRRKGIGRRLVELAVQRCQQGGFIKIFLTAIPGSEGFYRTLGFKETMSPVMTIRGEDGVPQVQP